MAIASQAGIHCGCDISWSYQECLRGNQICTLVSQERGSL